MALIISNPDWRENLLAVKKNFTSTAARALNDSSEMAVGVNKMQLPLETARSFELM